MVSFPNCKINIGLRIVKKRADGFHDLETVFYPVALHDAVEVIESKDSARAVDWSQSGLPVPGNQQDNTCIKAYQLIKKDFPELLPVKMHLHKAIPMGAGLGGGSADAAMVLKLLDTKFNLGLSIDQLMKYALQLGSDCPFFLLNKPCYATGRGEIMEVVNIDLSAYKILLVNPGIHINTGWAFSNITPATGIHHLEDLVKEPVDKWQQYITNDFEKPVFAAHPEIQQIKNELLAAGAAYASMSGSGSTLYGIFDKNVLPSFNFPAHYFQKWV